MKLPNGESAIVEEEKLRDYILDMNHPHGSSHAILFRDLLDIELSNWTVLRNALVDAARTAEVVPGKPSAYGQKFEMRYPMNGPQGPKTVLAVWLIPHGKTQPRLITCYVE